MIIKKIVLNNIRTYTHQEINFDESSILLSGDIGSGKSSILLAIEFAFFGLSRGQLSGDSLLRKGSNECFVELYFEIEDKEYCIKRGLKKSSVGIQQTTGYIIENGVKSEGTPIELKSKIISILGYPSNLKKSITSSKHFLIFRYTIYTPQEEMKKIILDSENRLDVLKDVFDIDKYKLIKKNCDLFLRKLDKEIYGQEIDINKISEKNNNKIELEKLILNTNKEIDLLNLKFEDITNKKKIIKKQINDLEITIEILNKNKQEFSLRDGELKSLIREVTNNNQYIESLKVKIKETEEELINSKIINENDLILKKNSLTENIEEMRKKDIKNKERIAILKNEMGKSEDLIKKLQSLESCPLCLQNVNDEHKKNVYSKERKKINDFEKELEELSKNKLDIHGMSKELENLNKLISENELNKFKKNKISEDIKKIEELEERNMNLKKQVGLLNEEKTTLNNKIERFSEIETNYSELKKNFDNISNEENDIRNKITKLKTEFDFYQKDIKKLNEEIEYLKEIKSKLDKNRGIRNWIKDYFIMLIDLIENHVMVKIQQEFDTHFQEWFNFLIEDENITARLDEKFTPIIESDGYEISFGDLSGGEKTSVALAYRLSLNKVVNDFISSIKTKDFIILDEPTDGFSSQQLDKLKDVLNEINVKQILIVSHETKIESFVDKVFKISKIDNVSHVV